MISAVIIDKRPNEMVLIRSIIKDSIALRSDEEITIRTYRGWDNDPKYAEDVLMNGLTDMIVISVDSREDIELTRKLRERFSEAFIFLLVKDKISPTEYVRPYTLPVSIALRSFTNTQLYHAVDEMIEAFIERRMASKEFFKIETKRGVTQLPYRKISFFEATGKKIVVRLGENEYSCYGTIDNLMALLPPNFVRCHRGYIVNIHKIREYIGAENIIILEDGTVIPVSRSYKFYIRNLVKN